MHGAVEEMAALRESVVQNRLLKKLDPPFCVDDMGLGKATPSIRYLGLLQRVLDEHRESEQKDDGVTSMSVKSLADIRRTAFDLDVLIPRQPRHSSIVSMNGGLPAVTPSRTLVPNELEYLDAFDFSTSHACHLAERIVKARQTPLQV
ncbi:hypothetical protein E4U54_006715 [Claviceps lovelessii]|nr:hypothetical protein E4U54_006715 [Claviceps lovelessii]